MGYLFTSKGEEGIEEGMWRGGKRRETGGWRGKGRGEVVPPLFGRKLRACALV